MRQQHWCPPSPEPTWTPPRPRELWTRTEGWAAGLQLAGLARRASRESGAPIRVRDDDRHLLDYFTAEVLPAVTPEQRDLLVRAAPLDRLSGSLCDAALQVSGGAEVLASLDRADLFMVALDARHQWFRCHRLFRDVLLREPREAMRQLGFGSPGWRSLLAACVVGALVLLVYPVTSWVTGATLSLRPDWPWLLIGIFAFNGAGRRAGVARLLLPATEGGSVLPGGGALDDAAGRARPRADRDHLRPAGRGRRRCWSQRSPRCRLPTCSTPDGPPFGRLRCCTPRLTASNSSSSRRRR